VGEGLRGPSAGAGAALKVNRHGEVSKAYRATLRQPKREDYEMLVRATLEALIEGRNDVIMTFSYLMKYPKDFPKGILEEKRDDGSNVRRIKANKLLAWLRSRGYTDITTEMIRTEGIRFTKNTQKIGELEELEEDEFEF
jgi:hypothetical protein